MTATDRQFLAANIADFRSEVLCDLSIEDLFLMFDDRLELGVIIGQRFQEFRESVEAEREIQAKELERDIAANRRERT